MHLWLFIVKHCVFDMTSVMKDAFSNVNVYYAPFSIKLNHFKVISRTVGVLPMINASLSSFGGMVSLNVPRFIFFQFEPFVPFLTQVILNMSPKYYQ